MVRTREVPVKDEGAAGAVRPEVFVVREDVSRAECDGLRAEGLGDAVARDLPLREPRGHLRRRHLDDGEVRLRHAVRGEELVEQELVRGLLVRDGEDLPPEVFDALDARPPDDDVAAQVAERARLEVDALLARLDGELDEHGGAVDLAGIERIHELRPRAVADELDAYAVRERRLRLREERQRVRDGEIGDADGADAVRRRARRIRPRAAAGGEEREQQEQREQQAVHGGHSFLFYQSLTPIRARRAPRRCHARSAARAPSDRC